MSTNDKDDLFEMFIGPKYRDYIWSILFSPILIAIFYAIYFIKSKNYDGLFTMIGLILTFVLLVVSKSVYTNWDQFWVSLLMNIIFTIIFIEYLWKKYFILPEKD